MPGAAGRSAESEPQACGDEALQGYYRLHARIYDATRWTFLFGRDAVVEEAARRCARPPRRILEVGCGTGRNLVQLARRFPGAALSGVDLCGSMLARARRTLARQGCRAALAEAAYGRPLDAGGFDLVLFSYSLSMFGSGVAPALDAALDDLAPGGLLAVADFHDTPSRLFERWMGLNHVRLDGRLLPELAARCAPAALSVRPAYAGLWRWFVFVGQKDVSRRLPG